MGRKKAVQEVESIHPLDALTQDHLKVIALLLWKDRFRITELSVRVTEADIKGLDDCVDFLGMTLAVQVCRTPGVPAHPGNAAKGIAPRPAGEPSPYITVSLTGKDKNGVLSTIRAVENNVEDQKLSQQARQITQAKEQAQFLGARLMQAAKTGETSTSEMMDAAQCLMLLSKA